MSVDLSELQESVDAACARIDDLLAERADLLALVAQQQQQITSLKKDLTESAALGEALASALTRVLNADSVMDRAEAERDARDLLKGTA